MSDPVRELIAAKLKERGLNMREVSLLLGHNHAYLQQYLDRATPKHLPEPVREGLAPILGLSPDELRPGRAALSAPFKPSFPQPIAGLMIPVLGLGEGSEDGWSLWNGEVVEYVARPAVLAGVPNAYAIYITGTSMEPRYHPGERLYIHPGKPLQIGNYVLVQRKEKSPGDGPRAVVKRLVKMSPEKLILEQYNPPKTFDVKFPQVGSIHRIVGSADI